MKAARSKKNLENKFKSPASGLRPFDVAAIWPHDESPFLLSMVGARQKFVATSFTPVDFQSLSNLKTKDWIDASHHPDDISQIPRWLVLLPYEAYASPTKEQADVARTMAWEIHAGLAWEANANGPRFVTKPSAKNARFHLEPSRIKNIIKNAESSHLETPKPIAMMPTISDDTYLDTATNLIRSIKAGDFYQINLLRYFNIHTKIDWSNLCALMNVNTGPHGVLLSSGREVIASFSPEKFIEIKQSSNRSEINTWPIKGTTARIANDEIADINAGEGLANSKKDLAELHMIIDLMRNDFLKICESKSVNVVNSGQLIKLEHVWHLEGHISGILKDDQSLHTILSAVCPGGSITGAPKVAAMNRIRLEEGRNRGYFMGNFLRINNDGSLQSNILIRTLVSDNWLRSSTYAAGSGLVIKSNPNDELAEIKTKCAVITHDNSKPKKNKINTEEE